MVPSAEDLTVLLKVLRADRDTTGQILERRDVIASEMQSWRLLHTSGFAKHQLRIAEIEREVDSVHLFQTAVIPGLLQTREYATAIIERTTQKSAREGSVQARMDRQASFDDLSKRFSFVIAQSALLWRYTDEAKHQSQLEALLAFSRRKNVEIRILTFERQLNEIPLHSFCIFGNKLVTVELLSSQATFVEEDLGVYQKAFERLRSAARPLQSVDLNAARLSVWSKP